MNLHTTFTAPGKTLTLPRSRQPFQGYPSKKQTVHRTEGGRILTEDDEQLSPENLRLIFQNLTITQADNLKSFLAHIGYSTTPFTVELHTGDTFEMYYASGIETLSLVRGDRLSVTLTLSQGADSGILLDQNLIANPNLASTDGTVAGIEGVVCE